MLRFNLNKQICHTSTYYCCIIAICFLLTVSGCGNSSTTEVQTPSVDPRFASAESMLNYYNQITTTGTKIDAGLLISLMYAENSIQKQLISISNLALPIAFLDQACWDMYGVGMSPASLSPPLAPNQQKAVMTETEASRAKATQITNDGEQEEIYLVKIDDRWWLSGYTLEYDPQFDLENIDLDKMEKAFGYMQSAASEMEQAVRNNTYDFVRHGTKAPTLVIMRLIALINQDHPEITDPTVLFDWSKGG